MGPGFNVLIVLILPGASVSVGQTIDRRIFEQCYGSMWSNYLTASCDTGQVISVISLQAFAKRRDTKCPQEETTQTPVPSGRCCMYSDSDCGDIYLGDGLIHYLSCNGRQDCTGIPIARMDTPCHNRQYLNKTNYMRMEYECVTSIGTVDLNLIMTNNPVHIWNPKYPDGNTFPPGYTWTCSVEASCQTHIVVTAMFLQFLKLASGVCGQRVTIEDGMQEKEISCESNNNYNIADVYTSSSHFIKFTMNNNVAANLDWRFWYRFQGDQKDSHVTIGCGSYSRNTANTPSPGNCTPMSSTQTTPPITPAPVPPANGGQNDINITDDTTLLIGILIPLAVILITVTVAIILCCKKNISDVCCNGQRAIYPFLSEIGYEADVANAKQSVVHTELEDKKHEKEKERKRTELKGRKKEKRRKKRESLQEQQQMNEIRHDPSRPATMPFRAADYAENDFHPPVMGLYYPGNGHENHCISDYNMYDLQLPLVGTIYGYPFNKQLNFHNNSAYGTENIPSASLSTDSNSSDAYMPPASLNRHPSTMPVSQRAGKAPLIFHRGQFDVPQG